MECCPGNRLSTTLRSSGTHQETKWCGSTHTSELKGSIFAAAKHSEKWNDVATCNPRMVLPTARTVATLVSGAERCAPGSCEAANNAKFTAAAASSPVALRPTAISFSVDSSGPSLPHDASCPRTRQSRLSLGTLVQAQFVVLMSPKPVVTDEDHESSRFSREESVATTSTPRSDSSVSHTHRCCSLILRSP